jgi:hypothetical protein
VEGRLTLWQVSDADQAEETKLVETMPEIHSYEKVALESCYSFVYLNIEPNEVLSREHHKTVELFVKLLRETL